ncbi:MAG: hypothetical protein VB858_13875, partial [Planctomycetaceae bacterium]
PQNQRVNLYCTWSGFLKNGYNPDQPFERPEETMGVVEFSDFRGGLLTGCQLQTRYLQRILRVKVAHAN